MYISSDGTKKSVKDMNTEYLINALAKSLREIYTSETINDYNVKSENIITLYNELIERQGKFLANKLDEGEWK